MKDYSFGNYICALRTGLGLSQFQLGTLVGVSDKAVSKWENGDARPRLATCYRLAEVLGVSISQLLSCKQISVPARKELKKMNHQLWKEAYDRLEVYGKNPPIECVSRLALEETILRGTNAVHAFAAVGNIRKVLLQHNAALVVRGSVNSSFTAWLFGATNVDPLQPHYRCPKCGRTEFVLHAVNGYDLPEKKCGCGEQYIRDGLDLPFESYSKPERDGPHLELNVSEKSMPVAVNTLLDFYKEKADILPIKMYCGDDRPVYRYVLLPENKPRPELSEDGFWHTTGDDYWQWQENEPSFTFLISKQLDELETLDMPLPDPVSLMTPAMARKLYHQRCEMAGFITDCLSSGEVRDFDLLLRIDSLSHSSGVWKDNGELLVREGTAVFRQIPAAREDLWKLVSQAAVAHGLRDNGLALTVMENARRGLFHSRGIPGHIRSAISTLDLPEWLPDHLSKILYLFPAGHCAAYLLADALAMWAAEIRQSSGK